MAGFDDNHIRALTTAFRHVDDMMTDLEAKMDESHPHSLFHEYTRDLPPAQKRMISTYIAVIQEAMITFLADQEIPFKRGGTSIRRVAETTIQFMHIAFEEMRPKHLRGYGALPDDAARALNELVSKITSLLERMQAELGSSQEDDRRT